MTAPVHNDARSESLIGKRLGAFIIRAKLAEGGFGAVYIAEQELLGREAVVKVLHSEHRGSMARLERFYREARLASRLSHPYAAHVYAFGAEADGVWWIAMERVRGMPLSELLQSGPLPLARFVLLFERLCEVVHAAHEEGIIHRDIKPSNVVVTASMGRLFPKLLDFGIAKIGADIRLSSQPILAERARSGSELAKANQSADVDDSRSATSERTRGEDQDRDRKEDTPTLTLHESTSERDAESGTLTDAPEAGFTLPGESITKADTLVGSPSYMAPELFRGASRASLQSDIYALGVLAFQCLTGRQPFSGSDVRTLARAHATEPVPPLDESHPRALNAVLRQAMAKEPKERYGNALELAAAFRAASGIAAHDEPVPQLDPTVAQVVMTEAPQPIAEAIAGLQSASTCGDALRTLRTAMQTLVRFLALLGLAGRARAGPGAPADSREVRELLQRLRRRELTDTEWLALGSYVCLPFAGREHLHPIPELVSFFRQPGGAEGPGSARIASMLLIIEAAGAVRAWSASPALPALAGKGDRSERATLSTLLTDLGQLLRSLSFLSAYTTGVVRRGQAQRWNGMRPSARQYIAVKGSALTDGAPVLIDPDGYIAVSLWPFIQVMAPSPGMPEELFFLEGMGQSGARLVAWPRAFTRDDGELWSWVASSLGIDLLRADSRESVNNLVPYRGLATFTAADTKLYYGREKEAEAFANRLRVQHFLAVVGPSGAGKSSFVQAGVVPRLPESWRVVIVRPGPLPLVALSKRLAQDEEDEDDEGDKRYEHDPERLVERLGKIGRHDPLLLVIDQFEELVTLCQDAATRQRYAEILVSASHDAQVHVVVTLRDDFLIRLQQVEALRDVLGPGLQLLGTPGPADLERILREPARQVGYRFEDPQLISEMIAQVADQPGALALLSFTAAKLWELRDRHFHQLTWRAYRSLGGVGGALAQHGEECLAGLSPSDQALVREAFRHLMTAEGTRAVMSRSELAQVMGGSESSEAVLEKLISARLLVASEGVEGEDRIEVIHEALLRSWPRLVEWRREDAESARVRDQLRAAARQWDQAGRPAGTLWRGDALAEYRVWRHRYPGSLTAVESEFAQASLREEARGTRIRRVLLGIAFALLTAGIVVLYSMNQRALRAQAQSQVFANEAQANAAKAQAHLVELYQEQGRRAVLDGDSMTGLLYLHEAKTLGAGSQALDMLISDAARVLGTRLFTLRGHRSEVQGAVFSPDGSQIATIDRGGEVRLWDASTGRELGALGRHEAGARWVAYSPDGALLATASEDKTARIWNVRSRALLARLDGHREMVVSVEFSPDGERVVTASRDSTARVWNARDGKLVSELVGHTDTLYFARFSPDGSRVLTGSHDATARIWDAGSGAAVFVLRDHDSRVRRGVFTPDGGRIITGDGSGAVRLWDAQAGELVTLIGRHLAQISCLAVIDGGEGREGGTGGSRLATGAVDGSLRLWSLPEAELAVSLSGHSATVNDCVFSPEGSRLLSGSNDGTAKIWDSRTGELRWTLVGHADKVQQVQFDPTGKRALTASHDKTAMLWDATQSWALMIVEAHRTTVYNALFSRDGERVLTTSADGSVKLWSAQAGTLLQAPDNIRTAAEGYTGDTPPFIAWSPDERMVATPHSAKEGHPAHDIALLLLETGKSLGVLSGHTAPVTYASFSPDGRYLVTASRDHTAKVWDVATQRLVTSLEGHKGGVWSAAFSPSGQRIVTAGDDKTAKIWDAGSGALVRTIEGHELGLARAIFSPEGERVLTSSADRTAKLWSVDTGALLALIQDEGAMADITFHRGGALVATASTDGVKLWDAHTGTLVRRFEGHRGIVFAVQFSVSGDRLVTGGQDGSFRIWDVTSTTLALADLKHFLRCLVPFALREGKIRPVEPDPSACANR